jgi:hypothetical protein
MPSPGFYDDNEGRSYPLVPFSGVPPGTPTDFPLPLDTLVDFGCLVGLDAEFEEAQHTVYLYEITRVDNIFTFEFRSDAPGLVGYVLVFSRDLADPEYATDYAVATPLAGSPPPQPPLWEGFLATGPMDSLAAVLPADGVLTASVGPQVEPALIQNLGLSYLRTINLANQDRTHVSPPAGCPGSGVPDPAPDYIVNATGLAGDLRFEEGYNISIRQSTQNNALTFLAMQAAGAGTPCEEVPLYAGEASPDGGSLLSGGPACDEVVGSINGLTASVIRLVPDLGTKITPSLDDPNTLVVDFDLNNMTVCGPVVTIVEELGDGD